MTCNLHVDYELNIMYIILIHGSYKSYLMNNPGSVACTELMLCILVLTGLGRAYALAFGERGASVVGECLVQSE